MSGRIETYDSRKEPTSKWSQNEAFSVREAGVDIGKSGGQGGSNVSVDQVVTSGREVAGVTVDGERTPILIPNAGEWTQSDWAETDPSDDAYIKNKPSLAQVATSGSYTDLSNTPDLSDFVEDANYVHTDYNYDLGAKNIVDHVTDNLAGKVDKVSGKVLSDNNFTNAQKDKLTNLADIYGVGANLTLDPETNILSANAQPITIDDEMSSSSTNAVQNRVITSALGDKVDKVSGKGLSTNDFTNAYKDKLDSIDQGAEVNDISTISVNGVNVPADVNKNVDLQISYPTVNNGTLTITQDGATLGSFTANQSSNSTIDIPAGGGGLLPHLIISAPTGSTVTATKGTTVITAVETSSGVFECDIPEYGDWLLEDGTDSYLLTVNNVARIYTSTANGATILPVNDVATWLRCGGRYETYTTVAEVLADTTCLSALIASDNASDYLARSTDFAADICADEMAMTYIGLSNHCSNALLAETTTWRQAIVDSSYFESVLNVRVPTMTSATLPEGECSANAVGAGQLWYPFQNLINATNANGGYWRGNGTSNQYLAYKFTRNVRIYKILTIMTGQHYTQSKSQTYKFQAVNSDSTVAVDITGNITRSYYGSNGGSVTKEIFYPHTVLTDKDTYRYFQISGDEVTPLICTLQFYGREDV